MTHTELYIWKAFLSAKQTDTMETVRVLTQNRSGDSTTVPKVQFYFTAHWYAYSCVIWVRGSHRVTEENGHLECITIKSGRSLLTFQKSILLLSSCKQASNKATDQASTALMSFSVRTITVLPRNLLIVAPTGSYHVGVTNMWGITQRYLSPQT
jgi:hypothetical protein